MGKHQSPARLDAHRRDDEHQQQPRENAAAVIPKDRPQTWAKAVAAERTVWLAAWRAGLALLRGYFSGLRGPLDRRRQVAAPLVGRGGVATACMAARRSHVLQPFLLLLNKGCFSRLACCSCAGGDWHRDWGSGGRGGKEVLLSGVFSKYLTVPGNQRRSVRLYPIPRENCSTCLTWYCSLYRYPSPTRVPYCLRARGGSTAASRRPFSDRCVQLSTTGIFCQKIGKCCTIKYYVRKIQNPGFWVNTKYIT